MKTTIKQEFNAPLDVVLRAREDRFNHLDKIEGLKKPEYASREENDNTIKTTRKFEISMANTPAPILKMLSEDMFKFEEVSVFDKANNVMTWEMIPKAKKDKMTWKGITTYKTAGDKTERNIDVNISVKVPFIGEQIEKMMSAGFQKSMGKDQRTIAAMCDLIQAGKV